jgi:hypothetical protein
MMGGVGRAGRGASAVLEGVRSCKGPTKYFELLPENRETADVRGV